MIVAFLDRYGPHAFGMASLLVIWFMIVNPELQRNQIDHEEQKVVLKQMESIVAQQREMVSQQTELAGILKETAQIMERIK